MTEDFENAIWAYYQNLKAHGWSAPGEGDSSSREALFWKTPAGKYGMQQIAAAWWGWQMCAAAAVEAALLPQVNVTPRCHVCGTTENLTHNGKHGFGAHYRCDSRGCMAF